MPQDLCDTGDELSLRHLPDISDASFSFQIPTTLSKGDLLLGDDDDDFFRNVKASPATPGLSRAVHAPLTLEDITPRPKAKPPQPQLDAPIPAPPFDLPTKPKSKHTPQGIAKVLKARSTTSRAAPKSKLAVTTGPTPPDLRAASPAAARLEVLRAEVQKLNDDLPGSAQAVSKDDVSSVQGTTPHEEKKEGKAKLVTSKREHLSVKTKRTVISGGVSKIRSKHASSTSITMRNVASIPQYHFAEPQKRTVQPAPRVAQPAIAESSFDEQNPDASVCSTMSDGGVAERLVMYSQRLMQSYGPFSLNPDPVPTILPVRNPEKLTTQKHEASLPEAVDTLGNIPSGSSSQTRDKNTTLFTLSQLSPCKRSPKTEPVPIPAPTPPAKEDRILAGNENAIPPSPMRASRKRPAGDTASASSSSAGTSASSLAAATQIQTQHVPPKAKKQKHDVEAKALVTGGVPKPTAAVDSHAAGKERIPVHNSSSGLGSSSRRSTRTIQNKSMGRSMSTSVSKRRPRGLNAAYQVPEGGAILAKPRQGRALATSAGGSGSSSGSGSRSRSGLGDSGSGGTAASTLRFSRADNLGVGMGTMGSSVNQDKDQQAGDGEDARCSSGASIGASGARADKRTAVNPTKPIEFKFHLDARLEARRAEHERDEKEREHSIKRSKHHAPLPIPDFKALHAQQEAESALRKENIMPTVPVLIELTTGERAREREKFDERVREKEKELEREREIRRKEREEEEEKEVREMRKRAVPRAHDVPEWYREAPKRKRRVEEEAEFAGQ